MEDRYVNCHAHIFNVKCAPDKFIGLPIAKTLSTKRWALRLIQGAMAVGKVAPFLSSSRREFVEKWNNFLKIGAQKSQHDVFNMLRSNYSFGPMSYVALTLNMEHMGAGKSVLNFQTQLAQVRELKMMYKDELIPFICVDPRAGSADQLLAMVRKHIEVHGFGGIKLYPPLGFYPFDPRLKKIYEYAQQYQIPVLTHVSKGGIFFRDSEISHEQLHPVSFSGNLARHTDVNGREGEAMDYSKEVRQTRRFLGRTWGKGKRNEEFKYHFADPRNYHVVLKAFPQLKICFAHFGGDAEIEAFVKEGNNVKHDNWHHVICEIMKVYPNTYADVSYALWQKKVWTRLKKTLDADDPNAIGIDDRVLFGTDYYMTIQEATEIKLVSDFRNAIGNSLFKKSAMENPKSFFKTRVPYVENEEILV